MQVISERNDDFFPWRERPDIEGNFKYNYIYAPVGLHVVSPNYTAIVQLARDEDVILSGFDKETRYEIRRASRENYSYCMKDKPDRSDLDGFLDVYRDFLVQKNLDINVMEFYEKELSRRAKEGCLFISQINSEEGIHIYHVYSAETQERIRLTCSASVYREFGSALKAKNGRFNRLLHWKDIQAFRSMGFLLYDLGGVRIDNGKAPDSGTKFKLAFSGLVEKRFIARGELDPPSLKNKTVLLQYDSKDWFCDSMAIELANQLSDTYNFVIGQREPAIETVSADLFWKTIEMCRLEKRIWGINPLCHYFGNRRNGKIVYGSNIEKEKLQMWNADFLNGVCPITMETSNEEFNRMDVCIFRISNERIWMKVLESMAAGCYPVIIADAGYDLEDMADIIEKGTVIRTENCNDTSIGQIGMWCQENIAQIREQEEKIAAAIYQYRRWEIMAQKMERLYLEIS